MRVMSFDIGIKNMAYCTFSVTESPKKYDIIDWNVLNLMDTDTAVIQKCTCKNLKHIECKKKAKYQKNEQFFCEKHAIQCSQFILPNLDFKSLNKKKVDELIRIGISHSIFNDLENIEKTKRTELLKKIQNFIDIKCLEPISAKKSKTAGETTIITIARNMTKLMNSVKEIDQITHVIIENQIVDRMKTIQGILTEYFIMKNPEIQIEFVSSQHKLKQFSKDRSENLENTLTLANAPVLSSTGTNTAAIQDKKIYKAHKSDAVFYCSQIIDKNPELHVWKPVLETKKKDDLADCFLQGFWYIHK